MDENEVDTNDSDVSTDGSLELSDLAYTEAVNRVISTKIDGEDSENSSKKSLIIVAAILAALLLLLVSRRRNYA